MTYCAVNASALSIRCRPRKPPSWWLLTNQCGPSERVKQQRRKWLRRARQFWRDATLLCITHDIAETRDFDRVLVIEAGRLVEQGPPGPLASDPGSRYRGLLDDEDSVRSALWSSPRWRRLRLQAGRLQGQAQENGCDRHSR